MTQPTRAGQVVRNLAHGTIGITADAPRARTPRIEVMFVGFSYTVLESLDELEVVDNLV